MMKNTSGLKKALAIVVLAIGSIVMVFPFYWMFISAFKTPAEIASIPPTWLPGSWKLDNFVYAFQTAPFHKYFVNSLIVAVCVVSITTLSTILAAFAFSRLHFRGRKVMFTLMLTMLMVPFEMLVITNYTTMNKMNLIDSLGALILPFTASVFYTYILRNFFIGIPESFYQAARIDGASNWQYLWKVMVPLARPSLVTIILLNFIASWNSFFWPLLVLFSADNRTLPVGLYAFMTEGGIHFERLMAASMVVVLPMIILFLFAKKKIVSGVARGGLKG